MGKRPCDCMSALSLARSRRASRPPWILGWSVFTRPPSISGAPVSSCTCLTGTPSLPSSAAVPPVERISMPSPASPLANSTIPDLSETERSARATVMRGLISLLAPRDQRQPAPERDATGGLVVLRVAGRPRLVVGDDPQLGEAAHLQLPDALAGEVHDDADFLEGDAGPVGDVERAGLGQLPQLLVGEVHLHRPGARVDVDVEVVLAGDVRARTRRGRAVGARLGPAGLHLRHQRLQLGIDSPGRHLLAELPSHLLAAHRAGALPGPLGLDWLL